MSRYNKSKNNLLLYLAEMVLEESKAHKKNNRKHLSARNIPYGETNPVEKSQKENYTKYDNSNIGSDNYEIYNPVSETKLYKRQYLCHEVGCNKSYTSNHGLQYHKKNGHLSKDESEKPFKCKYRNCGRAYKNVNGLKYHTRVEHDDI